jgi:hypothetical protein
MQNLTATALLLKILENVRDVILPVAAIGEHAEELHSVLAADERRLGIVLDVEAKHVDDLHRGGVAIAQVLDDSVKHTRFKRDNHVKLEPVLNRQSGSRLTILTSRTS